MMKSLFKIGLLPLVLLELLFILAGCEKSNSIAKRDEGMGELDREMELEENDSNYEKALIGEGIRIGFLMDTLEEERWARDRDLFKESAEALGAEVEIMIAAESDALQLEQAEKMISEGVDVLVIVPNNYETTAAIVKKAHQSGIKVISYDRLVKNADVDFYISFDNEMVGTLQAEYMVNVVPEGKYVYIGGADIDYNAHLIKKGVFDVLKPFIDEGKITVVFAAWTEDWTPENAYKNMMLALEANGLQIDVVIAGNDGTAGGAIQALEENGLAGAIPVAGQDADLAAVQRIVKGTQTLTIYKPIKRLSEKAAELAIRLAKGETVETDRKIYNGKIEVPAILLTPIVVDSQNIESTIIVDGFHSREAVYQE